MIDLNTTHPKFRYYHEVLCMLPLAPTAVPLASIASDLGWEYENVEAILCDISDRYSVCFDGRHDDLRVSIHPDSWERVNFTTNRYFKTVYGDAASPSGNAPSSSATNSAMLSADGGGELEGDTDGL